MQLLAGKDARLSFCVFLCNFTPKFFIQRYNYWSVSLVLGWGGGGRGHEFVLQKTLVNIWGRSLWSRLGVQGQRSALQNSQDTGQPLDTGSSAPKASDAGAEAWTHGGLPARRRARRAGGTQDLFRGVSVSTIDPVSSPKFTSGAGFMAGTETVYLQRSVEDPPSLPTRVQASPEAPEPSLVPCLASFRAAQAADENILFFAQNGFAQKTSSPFQLHGSHAGRKQERTGCRAADVREQRPSLGPRG